MFFFYILKELTSLSLSTNIGILLFGSMELADLSTHGTSAFGRVIAVFSENKVGQIPVGLMLFDSKTWSPKSG